MHRSDEKAYGCNQVKLLTLARENTVGIRIPNIFSIVHQPVDKPKLELMLSVARPGSELLR